jgi:hypothetical protein
MGRARLLQRLLSGLRFEMDGRAATENSDSEFQLQSLKICDVTSGSPVGTRMNSRFAEVREARHYQVVTR